MARIDVDKSLQTVRVLDQDGKVLAFFPASVGSEEKPTPSGTLKVVSIQDNPTYRYDPKYKFKGVSSTKPFTIRGGPNNPVGAVWIGLSKNSYGIHGTAEPSKVSKSEFSRVCPAHELGCATPGQSFEKGHRSRLQRWQDERQLISGPRQLYEARAVLCKSIKSQKSRTQPKSRKQDAREQQDFNDLSLTARLGDWHVDGNARHRRMLRARPYSRSRIMASRLGRRQAARTNPAKIHFLVRHPMIASPLSMR